MTEAELRDMVRQAIERYTETAPGTVAPHQTKRSGSGHASHAMFRLPAGGDGEGPCLIEPMVACTHCGYCRSYGH